MSRRMVIAGHLSRLILRPLLARIRPESLSHVDGHGPVIWRGPAYLRHVRRVECAGPPLHWIGVGRTMPDRLVYYIHGGAFVAGSPQSHAAMLGRLSRLSGIEICAPRYRLLQEAAFPAAFEDVLAGWDHLVARGYPARSISLGGDSAGAGLAFALLQHCLRRGERPAAIFAFSPWLDLTLSGESLARFGPRDPVLPVGRMEELRDRYLAGADPRDPRASPLWAEYPAPPPALIQVGSEEALLSDAERMAARLVAAGGPVTLERWPGALHAWQILDGWVPEARAALRRTAAFLREVRVDQPGPLPDRR